MRSCESLESIEGRRSVWIDAAALSRRLAGYADVEVDLGTGDGRYVRALAQRHPERFVIGVDACRENLHDASRRAPTNTLYLIANALALPGELDGLASRLTLNFPWGTLLGGLLDEQSGLSQRMAALVRPGGLLQIRLNAGALGEAGYPLEDGARRIRRQLREAGFSLEAPVALGPRELRTIPTTWAQRLAFGRDPRAVDLRGERLNVSLDREGEGHQGV